MITWCRLGQRALPGGLSASLFNVGRGLGYDSQPLAVHSPPVTVGDQALNISVRVLMPKWPGAGAQVMPAARRPRRPKRWRPAARGVWGEQFLGPDHRALRA
jgi:hypothetical protein